MWEALFSPMKIILDSLKILFSNKLVFTFILFFTILPLSTLIITQSISLHSRSIQIYYLEILALYSSTRIEARHVWQESRHDALSLLRTKALFSLPIYFLSLSAAISSVHSTVSTTSPTLHSAAKSIYFNYKRPFLTSIFIYAILFVFSSVRLIFSAVSASRFVVNTIASGIEVYLIAVLSVGLVVSIAEERFGWDAIRVGSGLMEGRRVCGWVLSGLLVLATRVIGLKVEESLAAGEVEPPEFLGLTDVVAKGIGAEEKAVLIGCYGLVILLSYVVMSVYYCECRKQHPIREAGSDDDNHHTLHSLSL
ncbi:hypothetical protein TanjilG_09473 [Lupinus angustifolius]|uniref:Transmembrane protein n=1 Tax=Lupinus angustifolius TaxID=3871 RepID=A0A4P1RVW8_LUPAN|nr:PREDICTED: uncharacterized protein LOC109346816 [Lupinus angustifolius]OIW19453.1 hypothetical protein TanjilG_09473 [Lupinus angustifolius]